MPFIVLFTAFHCPVRCSFTAFQHVSSEQVRPAVTELTTPFNAWMVRKAPPRCCASTAFVAQTVPLPCGPGPQVVGKCERGNPRQVQSTQLSSAFAAFARVFTALSLPFLCVFSLPFAAAARSFTAFHTAEHGGPLLSAGMAPHRRRAWHRAIGRGQAVDDRREGERASALKKALCVFHSLWQETVPLAVCSGEAVVRRRGQLGSGRRGATAP